NSGKRSGPRVEPGLAGDWRGRRPRFASVESRARAFLAFPLMKTQKKNGQSLYLQIRNNRRKWMAGATTATAAAVSASQAGTITINLLNNYISGLGGNHLNADLTGDGNAGRGNNRCPVFFSLPYNQWPHLYKSPQLFCGCLPQCRFRESLSR